MSGVCVAAELEAIRRHRAMARRRVWRCSRLDRYRAEIEALRAAGASLADIQVWLRRRRLRVARSTILRRLRAWEG